MCKCIVLLIAIKWKDRKMCLCSQIVIMIYESSIDNQNNQGRIKKRPYPIVQYNINKGGQIQ